MLAEYKRDMNHSYLILTTENTVDTVSYPVRMLLGNTVPALLKCHMQGLDGKILFYYDITSRQALPSFYENRLLNLEDLQFLFGCFIDIMEKLEEYLLDFGQLVLNPDYIFLDPSRKELRFCYLPGYGKPVELQFRMLVEYLLPKIDHSDTRAVTLGYGVYRKTLEEQFHLEDIREELYQIRSGSRLPGKNESGRSGSPDSVSKSSQRLLGTEEQGKIWNDIIQKQEEWKADTFLSDVEERFSWDIDRDHKENKIRKQEKENNSGRHKKKKPEISRDSQRKKTLVLLVGCAVGTAILLGVVIASRLNLVPPIRIQDFFGAAVVLLGIVVFVSLFFPKAFGKKRKEEENLNQLLKDAEKKAADSESIKDNKQEEPDEILPDSRKDPSASVFYRMAQEKTDDTKESQGEREPAFASWQRELGVKKENEEATGFGDFHETVLLASGKNEGPASLVSREPGELATIFLNEELTVIGKMKTAADVVIPLPTVSRIHAKIRKKDQQYYLTDLNSRNGTAVNGRMLHGEEEYLLHNEDEVDFAEARYIFLL